MSNHGINNEGKEIRQDYQGYYVIDYDGKRVNTNMYGEKIITSNNDEKYTGQNRRSNEEEKEFINSLSKTPVGFVVGLILFVIFSYAIINMFLPDPFKQIVWQIYKFKFLFLGIAVFPTISLIKSNKNELNSYVDKKSNKITKCIEADGKKIALANQILYTLATISLIRLTRVDAFILSDVLNIELIGGLIVLVRGYIVGTYILLSLKEKKPAKLFTWISYLKGKYIEGDEFIIS